MTPDRLLVAIPHGGILVPDEIPLESLAADFTDLLRNIDWYTQWLYDFRDILGNRQEDLPHCSLFLEGNRDPENLDAAVPLVDVHGRPVYRPGREPDRALRQRLARRYLEPFHRAIAEAIEAGAGFLLDGHATVAARGVGANQIELMNFQHPPGETQPQVFSPPAFVEAYARELSRRLPEVRITVNTSEYYTVYGHVCGAHALGGRRGAGRRVPAILQETHEGLYRNPDGTPDVAAINRLRRAFAESLRDMLRTVGGDPCWT